MNKVLNELKTINRHFERLCSLFEEIYPPKPIKKLCPSCKHYTIHSSDYPCSDCNRIQRVDHWKLAEEYSLSN